MNSKGQSVFEVTIALGVVAFILIALVSLGTLSLRNSNFSKQKTIAAKVAQETSEWLREERDKDWDLFSQRATTAKRCMVDLNWDTATTGPCAATQFINGSTSLKREIDLNIGPDTISSEIKIYWSDAKGYHEVAVSGLFSNWQNER